ncbi:MAG TPA: hypothetical protein PKH97_03230 [Tetrasphaera sp.]|jgi:hypothetical protein|uniref:Uncharacterized protein n=1 Tax=Nostocoides vanveenii TaxID=330835 RepID=A0ABN2L600_9MICO|nr:hypothetical protein [Tetrasphaera sp.]HNQ06180.1 hypothetical protein [Tetrasphaera sp.]
MGEALGYIVVVALVILGVVGTLAFWSDGSFKKDRPEPSMDAFYAEKNDQGGPRA